MAASNDDFNGTQGQLSQFIEFIEQWFPDRCACYPLEGFPGDWDSPFADLINIAALQPAGCLGQTRYQVFSVLSSKRRALSSGEIRSKILAYELDPEIVQSQGNLMAFWRNLSEPLGEERIIRLVEEARDSKIPFAFIIFSWVGEEGILGARIYHPPSLPTLMCLRMFQRHVGSVVCRRN